MPRPRLESLQCKIIAWAFTVAAVPILIWSVWSTPAIYRERDAIVLLILSLMCAPFCAPRVPYAVLFIGLLYPMMAGAEFGPTVSVCATAIYAIPAILFVRPERMAALMLFSVMICNAFLYSVAYHMVEAHSSVIAILVVAAVSFLMFYPLIQGGFRWRMPWAVNSLLCAIAATIYARSGRTTLLFALAVSPINAVVLAWSKYLAVRWFRRTLAETQTPQTPESARS